MGGCLTRRLGVTAGAATDPYWANVVLLMGFDGSFVDESSFARSVTVSGPVIESTGVQFGTAFARSNSNGYVRVADSDDFSFGSGDFTIELWFSDINRTGAGLITKWLSPNDQEWGIFVSSGLSGKLEFYWSTTGSNAASVSYNSGYASGTPYHIAFSRVGNTGHLCFAGTIVATVSMTGVTISNEPSRPTLFANNEGASAFLNNGGADEVRITKGVGRYSGAVSSSYTLSTTQKFPRS
jgi:hypothetical protein